MAWYSAISFGYAIAASKPSVSATRYRAYLSGAPDSTTDLYLQISHASLSMRRYGTSYMSLDIPSSAHPVDDLNDRINGELVLERLLLYTDGSTSSWGEMFRTSFTDFGYDRGPSSASYNLYGQEALTEGEPRLHLLDKVFSETKLKSGERQFRVPPEDNMDPWDNIKINDETIPVREVRMDISSSEIDLTLVEDLT